MDYKAERLLAPRQKAKDNPRFVVTNFAGNPQKVYEQAYVFAVTWRAGWPGMPRRSM